MDGVVGMILPLQVSRLPPAAEDSVVVGIQAADGIQMGRRNEENVDEDAVECTRGWDVVAAGQVDGDRRHGKHVVQ